MAGVAYLLLNREAHGGRQLKALDQAIARHPWSSLQDGLLLAMTMIVDAPRARVRPFQFHRRVIRAAAQDIARGSDVPNRAAGRLHCCPCLAPAPRGASRRWTPSRHQSSVAGVQEAIITGFVDGSRQSPLDAQGLEGRDCF